MNRWRFLTVVLLLLAFPVNTLSAQQPQPEQQEPAGMVQLTFPPEMELRLLVDYVSQRLGVKIIFDEQVSGKSISI